MMQKSLVPKGYSSSLSDDGGKSVIIEFHVTFLPQPFLFQHQSIPITAFSEFLVHLFPISVMSFIFTFHFR